MKVRLRFSKNGALVYIGHLDVMRYFQKLFRRAGIPVAYSEGFSPHQILSFTPPLPLGMSSTGEYADVVLTDSISSLEALSSLRKCSVPEIEIMSFRQLPEKCDNAMASVCAAKYRVCFRDSSLSIDLKDAVRKMMAKESITVLKKTKKNEKLIDIKPLIYDISAEDDGYVNMLISSGSVDNIKPEHVMSALSGKEDEMIPGRQLVMTRIDQYTLIDGTPVSLDMIGADIK